MISNTGSLSFAKLVMMSSTPAKSAGDLRYVSHDPSIHGNQRCLIQSWLQSVWGVCSFYVGVAESFTDAALAGSQTEEDCIFPFLKIYSNISTIWQSPIQSTIHYLAIHSSVHNYSFSLDLTRFYFRNKYFPYNHEHWSKIPSLHNCNDPKFNFYYTITCVSLPYLA